MGIALWSATGLVAFALARLIPAGRRPAWSGELLAALAIALLLGVVATALDFGGWNELDWRAGLFTFLGGFAAAGAVRALRVSEPASRPSRRR